MRAGIFHFFFRNEVSTHKYIYNIIKYVNKNRFRFKYTIIGKQVLRTVYDKITRVHYCNIRRA